MATCRHGMALNKYCQLCNYVPKLAHGGRPMTLGEIAADEEYTERQHTSATTPMPLPSDAAKRKAIPIHSGFIKYFPRAMAAVAELSRIGNDQHNPGTPLHWDRSKSGDELDALTRHLLEAGTIDTDGIRHSAKLAWRAMANLEKELEAAADV